MACVRCVLEQKGRGREVKHGRSARLTPAPAAAVRCLGQGLSSVLELLRDGSMERLRGETWGGRRRGGESRYLTDWQCPLSLPDENEKHEKLRLEREQEQRKASAPRANHAVPLEEPRGELLLPISPPAPAPPPPPPLAAPISVIPIPVVASPPQPAAQAALSPPLAQRHQPLVSTPGVTKEAPAVAPVIQRPPGPLLADGKAATPPSGSPKQLQHYAAPVLAISQHHVVQQPIQPQPLQHPGAAPQLGALKLAPAEDVKPNEQKKRPGG